MKLTAIKPIAKIPAKASLQLTPDQARRRMHQIVPVEYDEKGQPSSFMALTAIHFKKGEVINYLDDVTKSLLAHWQLEDQPAAVPEDRIPPKPINAGPDYDESAEAKERESRIEKAKNKKKEKAEKEKKAKAEAKARAKAAKDGKKAAAVADKPKADAPLNPSIKA